MVFGIGDGAIAILIGKPSYKEGEVVKGRVVLSLKKTMSARSIYVRLFAKEGEPEPGSDKKRELYSKKVVLDGVKSYLEGQHEYPFEIAVPYSGDLPHGMPFGFEWCIEAKLDVPFSLDIAAIEKIFVD